MLPSVIVLALMGLLAGYMMYRMKVDLIIVTILTVTITLLAMILGPLRQTRNAEGQVVQGPVGGAIVSLNNAINQISGGQPLFSVEDPTNADPRIPVPDPQTGERPKTAVYDPATGQIATMPSYIFWVIFLFGFSYLGANLAIWRFAQPVNYIGFWITLITIGLCAIGAILAPLTGAVDSAGNAIGPFTLPAVKTCLQ
jgi:carbon starvation protein CstA